MVSHDFKSIHLLTLTFRTLELRQILKSYFLFIGCREKFPFLFFSSGKIMDQFQALLIVLVPTNWSNNQRCNTPSKPC